MRTGLTVIAYITAKAGHQQQVREALLDLVAQTRNERGCVNYDLHQSQENATEFAIYENWDKASDLDLHMLNRLMFKSSPELRPPVGTSSADQKMDHGFRTQRHERVTLKSDFSSRLPSCGRGPSKGLFPDKRSCAAIR